MAVPMMDIWKMWVGVFQFIVLMMVASFGRVVVMFIGKNLVFMPQYLVRVFVFVPFGQMQPDSQHH